MYILNLLLALACLIARVFVWVFLFVIIFSSISMNVRAWVLACVFCMYLCECKIDGRMSGVCCGAAVCKDIRRLRWRVNSLSPAHFFSLWGRRCAWLQARFSFIISILCCALSLFSFYSNLGLARNNFISTMHKNVCLCMCVCVFLLSQDLLPLSLALSRTC